MGVREALYILQVKAGSTEADVKKAYRKKAKVHHPDAPGGNAEAFQKVKEAYDTLLLKGTRVGGKLTHAGLFGIMVRD